jgi:hypothetical protein
VRSYAALHTQFPHEPTTDQFFGEMQFEAYRALGEHVIDTIAAPGPYADIREFVAAAERAIRLRKRRKKE